MPAPEVRALMNSVIRRCARKRLYRHAERYHIVDFDDAVFVEDWHRDERQKIIDFATARAAEVQAAATREDLLTIFDSVSEYL